MSSSKFNLILKNLFRTCVTLFSEKTFGGATLGSRNCEFDRENYMIIIRVDLLSKIHDVKDSYVLNKLGLEILVDNENDPNTEMTISLTSPTISSSFDKDTGKMRIDKKEVSVTPQILEKHIREYVSRILSNEFTCVRVTPEQLRTYQEKFRVQADEQLACQNVDEENAEKVLEEQALMDEKYKKIGPGLLQAFNKLGKVTIDYFRYVGHGEFSMIIIKKGARSFSCNQSLELATLKFVKGHYWGEDQHYLDFTAPKNDVVWSTQYSRSTKSFAPDDLVSNNDDVLTMIAENIVKKLNFGKADEDIFITHATPFHTHKPISLASRSIFPDSY
jgi:hypothetical protein